MMAVSATSSTSDPIREPMLPVSQSRRNAGTAGEAEAPIREKKAAEPTPAQANAALAEINHTFELASIGVQFEFDKAADIMIVKVVDVESGELIRQLPAEEVVRISKMLRELQSQLQGLLLHQKA